MCGQGPGRASIVIIQIYAYGAQYFLEGNEKKFSKSVTTLQNVASDTDGKQTPDITLFFMPLQNVEYVVGTGK